MRYSLTLAALAASASANMVTVPLTAVVNVNNTLDMVESGRARLSGYKKSSPGGSGSVTVTNSGQSYIANVSVGGQDQNLIVDTGSSNLWCGAHTHCEPTKTGKSTRKAFHVKYGSGAVKGTEYNDQVELAGLTVSSQGVGAARRAQGFAGVDGIIGFGPVALTQNTVKGVQEIPTFMNNLAKSGAISSQVLGVSFLPLSGSESSAQNGELTLGGIDSSKYSGSLQYVPLLTSGDASYYWGVGISGYSFGSTSLPLGSATSGAIVDTGTTLIYLTQTAFQKLVSVSGGVVDQQAGGLISWTKAPTSTFTIQIGSVSLPLTPQQYLVPQDQYKNFGLSGSKYYGYFAEAGSGANNNVGNIIGQKFLENYYAVFDTDNSRIGFAPAN